MRNKRKNERKKETRSNGEKWKKKDNNTFNDMP